MSETNGDLVIPKLIMRAARVSHAVCLPDEPFGSSLDMLFMVIALRIANGRPITATTLSRQLEMPRATVSRKLAFLVRRKLVEQRGRMFVIHPALLSSDVRQLASKRLANTVIEAASKLPKMGEQPK